ncbi:L,D-transpeptidase family protein [Rhizobium rhizosphaerae]|uniref:L,D-transpeptidase family protein n=1 Tax=Xaviernesmea rhizosphaerae TaxID=1672749 RepID=UPI0009BF7CFF|nr:L,D-transpeptidase [Xaviernesmea rhizosphaerae]
MTTRFLPGRKDAPASSFDPAKRAGPARRLAQIALAAGLIAASALPAFSAERYGDRPPVIVSPDLTAPWLMQLGGAPDAPAAVSRANPQRAMPQRQVYQRQVIQPQVPQPVAGPAPAVRVRPQQQAAVLRPQVQASRFDPQYLPQMVAYETKEKPGTVVIDTNNRFLYLVTGSGQARRYGVGVGKPGFEWAGVHKVTRKAEWPSWHPPQDMVSREAAKGHYLPASMEGGPANPLGARAMYLGSTLYRIHGTNAPWTIGYAVSSGCIRMRNEDVVDLYERVKVGTRVIVQ